MSSDYRDPKSHAPPVGSGDQWGDLDGDLDKVSAPPQITPQPRRPDRGIPTKRELNPVNAKRHAPYPKLRGDDPDDTVEPVESIPVGGKIPAKRAGKAAQNPAAKAAKQATKRSAKKKAQDEPAGTSGDAGARTAGEEADEAPEAVRDDVVTIAVERGSKRFRINEIAPQRPVENPVQKTPLTITKTTGKRASNEALMQGGMIRSAESASWGATNLRATLVWTTCAGAAVILIVVAAILLTRPPEGGAEVRKPTDFGDPEEEKTAAAGAPEKADPLRALMDGESQAKKLFAKYATAGSVDDFLDIIHLPDKNRALLSEFWKPLGMGKGWKPGENCTWTVTGYADAKYGVLSGSLPNFTGFTAVFRPEGDGMKMDWRATVGHSSADYSELKQGLGDAGEIRAILSPGDFHTFSLPEGDFRCYRLTAPDREENVWAYTKLNGPIDQKLAARFVPSQLTGEAATEIPVLLVLARGPAQSLPNQWMISEVVRLDWLDG